MNWEYFPEVDARGSVNDFYTDNFPAISYIENNVIGNTLVYYILPGFIRAGYKEGLLCRHMKFSSCLLPTAIKNIYGYGYYCIIFNSINHFNLFLFIKYIESLPCKIEYSGFPSSHLFLQGCRILH